MAPRKLEVFESGNVLLACAGGEVVVSSYGGGGLCGQVTGSTVVDKVGRNCQILRRLVECQQSPLNELYSLTVLRLQLGFRLILSIEHLWKLVGWYHRFCAMVCSVNKYCSTREYQGGV